MYIGYLVPEFPGQTHGFFWREIEQLERLGGKVDIVSTRRPQQGESSHRWSDEAIARTTYLYPIPAVQMSTALWQLVKPGPAAWWRCASTVLHSPPQHVARMTALLAMGARLAAVGRKRGWTHLHVHSCADAANVALFSHLLSGLPYSLTLHGDLNGYGSNQEMKWSHAAFAIFVCAAVREQATRLVASHLPSWVGTAPMGVDVDVFSRRTPYVPFVGEGPMRIFSCGRLHPGKGHEDLIRSIAQARDDGWLMKLTIGGEDATGGAYRRHLEEVIQRLGLQAQVRLAGTLSEESIRGELEAAHVFALASHQEALGVATMEAMSMEVPVIVTRTGGVSELVEDGCEGLLVEPHRSDQLAAALAKCAKAPAICVQMGQAGRSKVEKCYHSGLSARAIVDGIKSHALTSRCVRPAAAPCAKH